MLPRSFVALGFLMAACGTAAAESEADVDRLTTYATLLGRGMACGADYEEPVRRVHGWVERVFPGPDEHMMAMFDWGVQYHARVQRRGEGPDSCPSVRRSFAESTWP